MNPITSVRRVVTGIFSLLLLSSGAAAGQLSLNLNGPVSGYVFDADSAILRPLLGIPGSSMMGKPVEFGFKLSQVLTLGARFVVASTSAYPDLVVLDMATKPPAVTPISGVSAAGLALAVASLDGTSAAFYEAGAQRAWIVTGLPKQPAVSHAVDLSSAGAVMQMAIRNDGRVLVFSASDRGVQTLYSWNESPGLRPVSAVVSVSAIAMTQNGGAIVADSGTDEVFAVWDAGGAAIRQFLVGAADGAVAPVGVGVSAGGRIHIANAGSATTITLDPSGRFLTSQACECEVSGLYALSDSVFRLTRALDRTIFLLDASSADNQILFVPKPESAK
jgi:hypothetical protein